MKLNPLAQTNCRFSKCFFRRDFSNVKRFFYSLITNNKTDQDALKKVSKQEV